MKRASQNGQFGQTVGTKHRTKTNKAKTQHYNDEQP